MFAVIYRFRIKDGKQEVFKKSWSDLTQLIMNYEGGLGSRLHQNNDFEYIAYAQWPNEETWKKSGGNLPPETKAIREVMRTSTDKIETLFAMPVTNDLLERIQ